MPLTPAERDELRAALASSAPRFAASLADTAFSRGLAVTRLDDGATTPIPVTATPVVIDEAEQARRLGLAARLSSATLKMSRAMLAGPHRELLLAALSPLERRLAADGEGPSTLVTTRVDFFAGQRLAALEVNATIPAMQAYSDIAAHTFLEVVGAAWGASAADVDGWKRANGSNARALHDALLAGYAQVRPGRTPRTVALLCRRNDAQLTEQRFLCARFREWGLDADVVHPDALADDDDAVRADGKAYELVYRHLFVRRLEAPGFPGAAAVTRLLAEPNGTRAVLLNPPSSQVEVKLVFAFLSMAREDAGLARAAGLTDDELEAIADAVPWTRHFRGPQLLERVAAEPDRYVLKRSWDYGGKAVFVGRTRHEAGFGERTRAAWGATLDWRGVCERALVDEAGGGFVVQETIDSVPERHLLCGAGGPKEVDLFVDYSAYASVGLGASPGWGGVCRGSVSNVVNIVGGGGVIPLLTAETARALLAAHRRCAT